MEAELSNADTWEEGKSDAPQSTGGRSSSGNVRVVIRVRPLLPLEDGSDVCIAVPPGEDPNDLDSDGAGGGPRRTVEIQHHGSEPKAFTFDQVLPSETTQRDMYGTTVLPLIDTCLIEGFNATVLAYGQTGSGKTFTIFGRDEDDDDGSRVDGQRGVIPRSLREIYSRLESAKANGGHNNGNKENVTRPTPTPQDTKSARPSFNYEVHLQSIEIYGEFIRDLLDPEPVLYGKKQKSLKIRDSGGGSEPEVVGATTTPATSYKDAMKVLTNGLDRRVVGATDMNAGSSRSHVIMSVIITQRKRVGKKSVEVRKSKFHFVDLAGSECLKRTNAEGTRMKEGIDINKGLSVLGRVICALGQQQKQPKKNKKKIVVPYRDSKLTRLLRGSLGGNHKTLMIACVSPSTLNHEESLRCLRYASRARHIQNRAEANVTVDGIDPKEAKQLRTQVKTMTDQMSLVKEHLRVVAVEMLKSRGGVSEGGGLSIAALEKLANGHVLSRDDMSVASNSSHRMEDLVAAATKKEQESILPSFSLDRASTPSPPLNPWDENDKDGDAPLFDDDSVTGAPLTAVILPTESQDTNDDMPSRNFKDDVSSLAASDYQHVVALKDELAVAKAERDRYRLKLEGIMPFASASPYYSRGDDYEDASLTTKGSFSSKGPDNMNDFYNEWVESDDEDSGSDDDSFCVSDCDSTLYLDFPSRPVESFDAYPPLPLHGLKAQPYEHDSQQTLSTHTGVTSVEERSAGAATEGKRPETARGVLQSESSLRNVFGRTIRSFSLFSSSSRNLRNGGEDTDSVVGGGDNLSVVPERNDRAAGPRRRMSLLSYSSCRSFVSQLQPLSSEAMSRDTTGQA